MIATSVGSRSIDDAAEDFVEPIEHDIEDESIEDYAERRKFEIVNPS